MATGTSSRGERRSLRAALAAAAAVLAFGFTLVALSPIDPAPATAFKWAHPTSTPVGWRLAVTPSGASFAYPTAWRTIESDPGTVSAAPAGRRPAFRGYLNATPQSGGETLANWTRFRVAHVAAEGARDVRLDGAAHGLRFPGGATGSCVIDSYSTHVTRFREIACIVAGRRTTVVVAAAPATGWARRAPLLELAVSSFAT
jgi:hypothetical protein